MNVRDMAARYEAAIASLNEDSSSSPLPSAPVITQPLESITSTDIETSRIADEDPTINDVVQTPVNGKVSVLLKKIEAKTNIDIGNESLQDDSSLDQNDANEPFDRACPSYSKRSIIITNVKATTTSSTINTNSNMSTSIDEDEDVIESNIHGAQNPSDTYTAPPSTSTVSSYGGGTNWSTSDNNFTTLNNTIIIHNIVSNLNKQPNLTQASSTDDFLLDIVDVALVGDVSSIASDDSDRDDIFEEVPGSPIQLLQDEIVERDSIDVPSNGFQHHDEEDEDSGSVSVLIPWNCEDVELQMDVNRMKLDSELDIECPSPPSGPPPPTISSSTIPARHSIDASLLSIRHSRNHDANNRLPHYNVSNIVNNNTVNNNRPYSDQYPSTTNSKKSNEETKQRSHQYPRSLSTNHDKPSIQRTLSTSSSTEHKTHRTSYSMDGISASLPRLPKAKVMLARKRTSSAASNPNQIQESKNKETTDKGHSSLHLNGARKLVREYSHPSELLSGHVSMVVSDHATHGAPPRTLQEAADAALRRHASRQQANTEQMYESNESSADIEQQTNTTTQIGYDFPLATSSIQRYGRRRNIFLGGAGACIGAPPVNDDTRYSGEEALERERAKKNRNRDDGKSAKRRIRSRHNNSINSTDNNEQPHYNSQDERRTDEQEQPQNQWAQKTGSMISGTVMRVSLAADPWIDFITEGQSVAFMGGKPASAFRKIVRKIFGKRFEHTPEITNGAPTAGERGGLRSKTGQQQNSPQLHSQPQPQL